MDIQKKVCLARLICYGFEQENRFPNILIQELSAEDIEFLNKLLDVLIRAQSVRKAEDIK